jgi:hypothetical protein
VADGQPQALWWLWAWAVWMGFNLLLMVIYPTFIAPLFNNSSRWKTKPSKRA